jgi:hypothetical protein
MGGDDGESARPGQPAGESAISRAQERRRFIRLPSWLSARYTVAGSGGSSEQSVPRSALTRNASRGGVGFFTDSRLVPGTILQMQVTLPRQQRTVHFTTEVVWSGHLLLDAQSPRPHAYEVGARFLEITPEDLALLTQYSTTVTNEPPSPPAAS